MGWAWIPPGACLTPLDSKLSLEIPRSDVVECRMEKAELPHAFNYNEEKCHSKIYIFLVRVLCPRPTPSQPSLSGHAAEPRNLTCRAPGLAKTGLVLSEQHQDVVTKRPAYFTSHNSLRRPRRTKEHPRPLHVDPSDLEPAAGGGSWDKESGLCGLRSWSSPGG